eukprot:UN12603
MQHRHIVVIGIGAHNVKHDLKQRGTKAWNKSMEHLFEELTMYQNHLNIKFIIRTGTIFPRFELKLRKWNNLMYEQAVKYKNITFWDSHLWSVNWKFNFDQIDRTQKKHKLWNAMRTECCPCADFNECIHFHLECRLVLLQQTLNAIDFALQQM